MNRGLRIALLAANRRTAGYGTIVPASGGHPEILPGMALEWRENVPTQTKQTILISVN